MSRTVEHFAITAKSFSSRFLQALPPLKQQKAPSSWLEQGRLIAGVAEQRCRATPGTSSSSAKIPTT